MNVISLFDGMSCLQIALKELGIIPEKYYASEIDKYAIAQTQLNFPDTIQLGSVTEWETWDIDWSTIDLITFGSPCQGFSFAGKQLAFNDPRSELFFVAVEILNHIKEHNPKVLFLMENVDMKKNELRIISEYLGLFHVNINSSLLSAQNRSRNYWSNIRTKKVGLFDEIYTDIPQPKDRGILLKDILEAEVDEKYFLSDKMLNYFDKRANNFNNGKVNIREENDKASTITASCKSVDISDNFVLGIFSKDGTKKPNKDKASCFTAGGHSGGNHSDMDLICVSPGPANLVMTKNYAQFDVSGKGYKSQQDKAFFDTGKHGALTTARAGTKEKVLIFAKDLHNTELSTIFANKNKKDEIEVEERPDKILFALQQITGTQEDGEWQMAVYARFFENEILLNELSIGGLQAKKEPSKDNKEWTIPGTETNSNVGLYDLQNKDGDGRTSQRRKSIKQFIRQLAESLSELSQLTASQKKIMHSVWSTPKRFRILRKALSEIQEIWESVYGKTEPIQQPKSIGRIRRLTPLEAARLQTVPDWYNWDGMSDTRRYCVLGNGWTIEVIKWILSFLPQKIQFSP